jgi:general stress protein 26
MADNTVTPTPTGRPHMPVGYGLAAADAGTLLPWAWAGQRLAAARNYWLATTRPDGRPHVAPVWGLWVEDAFYFGTDQAARKALNLADNPAITLHLESGDEVVIIEGVAEPVMDDRLLRRLDVMYRAKYRVDLVSEEPGGALILRVRPQVALAWLESDFPNTATRWQFK